MKLKARKGASAPSIRPFPGLRSVAGFLAFSYILVSALAALPPAKTRWGRLNTILAYPDSGLRPFARQALGLLHMVPAEPSGDLNGPLKDESFDARLRGGGLEISVPLADTFNRGLLRVCDAPSLAFMQALALRPDASVSGDLLSWALSRVLGPGSSRLTSGEVMRKSRAMLVYARGESLPSASDVLYSGKIVIDRVPR